MASLFPEEKIFPGSQKNLLQRYSIKSCKRKRSDNLFIEAELFRGGRPLATFRFRRWKVEIDAASIDVVVDHIPFHGLEADLARHVECGH